MVGSVIKGRYKINELLGRGGVASVYMATDEVLGRAVAIKVLDERCARDEVFVERFNREAQAAASMHHPNAVAVFDTGEDYGIHFIVMEFVEGRSLKEVLEDGPLSPAQAARIGVQIARALGHAHKSGIIHRDVKSSNVLVANDGVVKVADFGIARALDRPGITQTGKVLGTAEYLSPEQASGRLADERSDIYSFGVVLFEMLSGRVPFQGKTVVDVAMKQVTEPAPHLCELNPGVPPGLSAFVDRLLSKDPGERPASFTEVVDELSPWIAVESVTAPIPVQSPAKKFSWVAFPIGAPRWLRAVVTVAACLAIACVYLVASRKPVPSTKSANPESVRPLVSLTPVSKMDYDPEGNGAERPDELDLAFDGANGSAWHTEGYASADFGKLKKGVGIYVDMGAPRGVKEIRVRSLSSGWDAQIKGSNDAKSWRIISESRDTPGDFTFKTSGAYRYYLLWIIKLTQVQGLSGYRVAVDDFAIKGR